MQFYQMCTISVQLDLLLLLISDADSRWIKSPFVHILVAGLDYYSMGLFFFLSAYSMDLLI